MKNPEQFTIEETVELVKLISWAVNGAEQGVINYDQWKEECRKLKVMLQQKGYAPHGQWATL